MFSAEVICDSINEQGNRLTTMKLRYPKFIHGEAKTHRVLRLGNEGGYVVLDQEVGLMDDPNLSRNASSSRAVPTSKLLEEVRNEATRAAPIFWGRNQKGMQAAEEFTGTELEKVKEVWELAACQAVLHAEGMMTYGAHKQIVNRILEPYTHINVVVTATEWNNFFGLRLHKDVQPEMRHLAILMWEARKASEPKLLKPGEWHLPFIEWEGLNSDFDTRIARIPLLDQCRKVSVARCARVSYESFETSKRSTIEEDLALYDRLQSGGHWSPFEHQATPDKRDSGGWWSGEDWGNFVGWRQFRKIIVGEKFAPIPEEFTMKYENEKAPRQDGTVRKAHYGEGEQPWDTALRLGWAHHFAATNVLKYLRRAKDEEHSLESARVYYQWLYRLAREIGYRYNWWAEADDTLTNLDKELTPKEKAKLNV